MSSGLIFLLLIPAAAVLLILFRLPAKAVALGAAILNLGVSLALLFGFTPGRAGYQYEQDYSWIQFPGVMNIHFHLGVDGINLPLILLATIVTVAAVAISPADIKRPAEFFSYLMIISLGVIGAFVSLDLFFLYIFHEFALVPTFLLIGIWGSGQRQLASTQLTIYLALGSLVLLAGVVGLVLACDIQTFDIPSLQDYVRNHPLIYHQQNIIFPLLFIGFGILISLFPFHSWAPSGYASAPPAAAMMHAGILKKFGLYGLIRVVMPLLPEGAQHYQGWVLALLLGNILYVGLVTLAQTELTTMLGFSSVMHMGYLFLGIAAWNVTGLSGVILLMVAHGLSAALLFGLAGEIQQRTKEIRMSELGGLAKKAPFLGVAFLIGSMASIGLPGLGNFAGEVLIFFGSWKSFSAITFLALWGVVISSVYQLRAVRNVLFGETPSRFAEVSDINGWCRRAPYVLLIVSSLFLGFFPSYFLNFIQPSVSALLGLLK